MIPYGGDAVIQRVRDARLVGIIEAQDAGVQVAADRLGRVAKAFVQPHDTGARIQVEVAVTDDDAGRVARAGGGDAAQGERRNG